MTETATIKKLSYLASDAIKRAKGILIPLWRILTFSPVDAGILPQKGLCVSIERDAFHIVYGSRFLTKFSIDKSKRYSFEGKQPQPDALASSVALFRDEFKISASNVSVAIPKEWSIVKVVEFPSTVKENLQNVLLYEMDRLTPFEPDNALYDFRILKEVNGKLFVSLFAARADVINPYIDALREKGISVGCIMLRLSGIGSLCRYIDKKMTDFIFVDVKEDGYEGALFSNGFIFSAFRGVFSDNNDKSKADAIMNKVSSLLSDFKAASPKLYMSLKGVPSLKEILRLRISIPYKIIDEVDIRFDQKKDVSYAAMGGLLESLWAKAFSLNLLKKGVYTVPKSPLSLTLIVSIAILSMGIFYAAMPLSIEKKRLKEIEKQINARKEDVKKIEALKRDMEAVREDILTTTNFKVAKPMIINTLKELTTIIPQNAWLTRVRISDSGVEIEGYSLSTAELIPKLEASKHFKKVEFTAPTFRDAAMKADRFSMRMELEGIKAELAKEEIKDEE